MALLAKGGVAAWQFLLFSSGEERVVFPHALICDNKELQIVFSKHTLGLSVLRFASD